MRLFETTMGEIQGKFTQELEIWLIYKAKDFKLFWVVKLKATKTSCVELLTSFLKTKSR